MQHKIEDQGEFKGIREVLCPLDKLLDESIMKSDLYQFNDGQTDKLCYVYYIQRGISMNKVKEYFCDDLKMYESIKDYNV